MFLHVFVYLLYNITLEKKYGKAGVTVIDLYGNMRFKLRLIYLFISDHHPGRIKPADCMYILPVKCLSPNTVMICSHGFTSQLRHDIFSVHMDLIYRATCLAGTVASVPIHPTHPVYTLLRILISSLCRLSILSSLLVCLMYVFFYVCGGYANGGAVCGHWTEASADK